MLILLAALTAAFALAIYIGSVILQGWLYNDLARRLPLRALASGFIMALFLTAWCAVYKNDPGRFDTLFGFKTETLDVSHDEFQSIRKVGKDEKKPVKFVRNGSKNEFVSAEGGKAWHRSDADGMVVALLIPEKGKEPVRFNAVLEPNGTFPASGVRFKEEKGKRYTDDVTLGKVYRVRSFAVIGNLLANFLHAALWGIVLWLGMRFALGHAIGIGLAIWGIVMIGVQPALFDWVTK